MKTLRKSPPPIKSTKFKITIVFFMFLVTGCSNGIRFLPSVTPENKVIPPNIINSVPASIYRHDLNALTGQLAVVDSSGVITPVLRAVDPQNTPLVTTIPEENGLLYQSIVTAEGNDLLKSVIGSVRLSAGQKAELTVKQISLSMLQEIPREIVQSNAKKINPLENQKIVYITGAVLSLVKITMFEELSSDAVVEYGPIFGINGKIYKSSSSAKNEYIITINTVDVDLLRDESLKAIVVSNDKVKILTLPAPTAPTPAVPSRLDSTIKSIPAQSTIVFAPVISKPAQNDAAEQQNKINVIE